jgi:uncharacterized RmlC-like cupin family protein
MWHAMITRRCCVSVVLMLAVGAVARAQQPTLPPPPVYPALDGFSYWSSADLKGLLNKLLVVATERGTPVAIERFGDAGSFKFFVERREPGEFAPEAHTTIDDLILVLDGQARLAYGGTIEGGREVSDGEIRGGRIVGGETRMLSTGDLFFVPAGMPHHMMVAPGEHYYVLVVKATSTKAAQGHSPGKRP